MILNNNFKILPTKTFKTELDNIVHYLKYNLKSPLLSRKFYKLVISSINSLKFMPQRHKLIKVKNDKVYLRKKCICNYVIIYEIDNNSRSNFHFAHLPF